MNEITRPASVLPGAPPEPATQDACTDACCSGAEAPAPAAVAVNIGRTPPVLRKSSRLAQIPIATPRSAPAAAPCTDACCSAEAAPPSAAPPAAEHTADGVRTPIRIMEMCCPTEEGMLRAALARLPGVSALDFNLMSRELSVTHRAEVLPEVLAAIRKLGFNPETAATVSPEAGETTTAAAAAALRWRALVFAGLCALGAEIAHLASAPEWLAAALALVAVLSCGLDTFRKGWLSVRYGNLNINALMSVAVTGALLIGQWPEAAMVMVLFTLAELIEERSLDRARNAIRQLLQLAPERATVRQADGGWREVAAAEVAVGAIVRVRPGERIALDGEILSGQSSVNQAPITGESLPVDKGPGDAVFAGTINAEGSFEFRVGAPASASTLARIIQIVESAQGAKAPTQRFVERFARIYTPAVFAFALAVAILPPLAGYGAWLEWIYRALVLLVIACPCALVISTPVTIVSGLAAAARQGILIKGGVYLEEGCKLDAIALDKTGTLTEGRPRQTDFEVLDAGVSQAGLRSLAASLAARSDHPVSRALSEAATRDGIALQSVEAFEALPGRGTRGRIAGRDYFLGNHRLIHESGCCDTRLEARIEALERQGRSVIVLGDGERALALFAVADQLRAQTRAAIDALHALGVRTLMLSGDNAHTARAIAAEAGIDEAHGELLPQDKLDLLEAAAQKGQRIGMVGDGINDAPALARADVGFAMGAAGTGTAIETADVALMDDDLRKLPRFIELSRRTRSLLVQNISLALGIKAAFLVLTLAGLGSMWAAVFADVGTSVLVVANGLRLLRS